MIIGDLYINNFLVLAIVLLLFGGLGLLIVPGDAGTGQTDQNQSNGNYELLVSGQGLQAGSFQDVTLVDDTGDPVSGISVLLNGQEVGKTGDDGSVTLEVPNQSTVTVSASSSRVDFEKNFQVEGSGSSGDNSDQGENGDGSGNNDSDGDSQEDGGDGGNENTTDDSGDENNTDNSGNNTTEADINRLSPENQQLNSASFEASYELQAENASYKLSLAEQKKASGNLDGEKTVNEQVSMPFNGTAGLEMEIVREGEVLASENLTVNYTAEGSNDGSNDSSGGEDPAEVTADLSVPSSVHVGDALEADASGSTGDIINYTWNFGEGTEETREASTIEHTYSSEGTYEFVVTVNGENSTEDNALETIEVRSLQEPLINFQSPLDNYETDEASIQYEFEVENASSDAEYFILIDQTSTATGTLQEGSNTVQKTVEVPEKVFNTSIQVEQNGETYNSEKRTINSSKSAPEPDILLRKPTDGSEYSSTDVEYNFTVYNGLESSTYEIVADGGSVSTGELGEDGKITLSPEATLPEGEYTTHIEVDQGGQTYTSESVSIVVGQTDPDPSVTFDSPEDGETVSESFDETTDVSLNYTVEDRGWAQDATLSLENYEGDKIGDRTHSVSSGQSYSFTFEDIPTYKQESEAEYTWTIEFTGGGNSETFGPSSFFAKRLEHIDVAELHSVEQNESYSGVFNYSAMSNSRNGRILEIVRNDTVIAQRSYYESFDIDNRVEEFWIYEKGQHDVKIILRDVDTDEMVAESQTLRFETTELPPDAGGGGGS